MYSEIKEVVNNYGEKSQKKVYKVGKILSHVILGIVGLILIFGSFGIVSAGEIGVRVKFGKVVSVVEQGLYFKIPLIETVRKLNTKTLTINYDKNGNEGDTAESSALAGASKDLQDVAIGVMVNYRIDSSKAVEIYNQYKTNSNYELNVLEPIVREVVKSTSAQYTAEELVTKRAEYSDKVNVVLRDRFTEKFAMMENLRVTNFEFAKSFSAAIEAKVTAVQNSEAAKNKLEQIKYEAQQTVEKAKAEAEAIRIQAQAINSQGGADYVQLQAVSKWDGKLPTQMIPGGTVPFLNLKN